MAAKHLLSGNTITLESYRPLVSPLLITPDAFRSNSAVGRIGRPRDFVSIEALEEEFGLRSGIDDARTTQRRPGCNPASRVTSQDNGSRNRETVFGGHRLHRDIRAVRHDVEALSVRLRGRRVSLTGQSIKDTAQAAVQALPTVYDHSQMRSPVDCSTATYEPYVQRSRQRHSIHVTASARLATAAALVEGTKLNSDRSASDFASDGRLPQSVRHDLDNGHGTGRERRDSYGGDAGSNGASSNESTQATESCAVEIQRRLSMRRRLSLHLPLLPEVHVACPAPHDDKQAAKVASAPSESSAESPDVRTGMPGRASIELLRAQQRRLEAAIDGHVSSGDPLWLKTVFTRPAETADPSSSGGSADKVGKSVSRLHWRVPDRLTTARNELDRAVGDVGRRATADIAQELRRSLDGVTTAIEGRSVWPDALVLAKTLQSPAPVYVNVAGGASSGGGPGGGGSSGATILPVAVPTMPGPYGLPMAAGPAMFPFASFQLSAPVALPMAVPMAVPMALPPPPAPILVTNVLKHVTGDPITSVEGAYANRDLAALAAKDESSLLGAGSYGAVDTASQLYEASTHLSSAHLRLPLSDKRGAVQSLYDSLARRHTRGLVRDVDAACAVGAAELIAAVDGVASARAEGAMARVLAHGSRFGWRAPLSLPGRVSRVAVDGPEPRRPSTTVSASAAATFAYAAGRAQGELEMARDLDRRYERALRSHCAPASCRGACGCGCAGAAPHGSCMCSCSTGHSMRPPHWSPPYGPPGAYGAPAWGGYGYGGSSYGHGGGSWPYGYGAGYGWTMPVTGAAVPVPAPVSSAAATARSAAPEQHQPAAGESSASSRASVTGSHGDPGSARSSSSSSSTSASAAAPPTDGPSTDRGSGAAVPASNPHLADETTTRLRSEHSLTDPPSLGHAGRGMAGAAPTPFNLAALGHAADIQRIAETMAANAGGR